MVLLTAARSRMQSSTEYLWAANASLVLGPDLGCYELAELLELWIVFLDMSQFGMSAVQADVSESGFEQPLLATWHLSI